MLLFAVVYELQYVDNVVDFPFSFDDYPLKTFDLSWGGKLTFNIDQFEAEKIHTHTQIWLNCTVCIQGMIEKFIKYYIFLWFECANQKKIPIKILRDGSTIYQAFFFRHHRSIAEIHKMQFLDVFGTIHE